MRKRELVNILSAKLNWSKAKTNRTLDEFFKLASEVILDEGRLNLPGLGVFTVKHRASRRGRNPATGEQLLLPPKDYIKFKASKSLIESINR